MLLKCNYCDPVTKRGKKPIKTIDTDIDDYIRDEKRKYYHTDCYKIFLKTKKKMEDSEIESLVQDLKSNLELEMQEIISKDKFLSWIMNYYDSSLPSYFITRVTEVRKGTYKGLNEPIGYETLLDIYTYMEKYLNKLAFQKKFDSISDRMKYDLAVVIGNYGDYKRFKEKMRATNIINEKSDDVFKEQLVVDKIVKSKGDDDKFSLSNVIDDILL